MKRDVVRSVSDPIFEIFGVFGDALANPRDCVDVEERTEAIVLPLHLLDIPSPFLEGLYDLRVNGHYVYRTMHPDDALALSATNL
jgi:hypothetical protein